VPKCKRYVRVAQALVYDAGANTLTDQESRPSVPQIVKANAGQACLS